jgi:hypothetical protein
MIALVSSLTRLFGSLTTATAYFLQRKLMFATAYVAAYIALVVVFATSINGLLSNVANSVPSHSLLQAGLSLVPANSGFLLAQISAAYLASWIYSFHLNVLKIKVNS